MKEGCRENGKNENKEIPSKIKHNKNVRVSVGISNRTNKRTTFIFTRIGCTKTRIYFITIKTNIRYPVVGIYIYIYTHVSYGFIYMFTYIRVRFLLVHARFPSHTQGYRAMLWYTYYTYIIRIGIFYCCYYYCTIIIVQVYTVISGGGIIQLFDRRR